VTVFTEPLADARVETVLETYSWALVLVSTESGPVRLSDKVITK
jgi:hypothetical protein